MKRYFYHAGIICFFCMMLGLIIMLDCVLAVGYTKQRRGLANTFSDYTVCFIVQQAESPDSFTQGELWNLIEEKQIDHMLLANSAQQGAELYENSGDWFQMEAGNQSGVWIREDYHSSLISSDGEVFYYKNQKYDVIGRYPKSRAYENFVIYLGSTLNSSEQTAMNGTWYLDCGENTKAVYQELTADILEKNQYAQIFLTETQADGYTLSRIVQSEDAMYYMLQMVILIILNLINFGNIAAYWMQMREREIFVRRMTGGVLYDVYISLIIPFGIITLLSVTVGLIVGIAAGSFLAAMSMEAIQMGLALAIMQWIVLIIFGSFVLIRKIKLPIVALGKSEQ